MIVHIREQWSSIIHDYLGYIYFYCLVVLSLYNFSIFLFFAGIKFARLLRRFKIVEEKLLSLPNGQKI